MENVSLKDLFVPQVDETEDAGDDESVILLHFEYGGKLLVTSIELVKEIVDFPFYIPLPGDSPFLGVFNLRGSIIPIFDPLKIPVVEGKRTRLIVFETEKDVLVAVPANSIFKNQVEKDTFNKHPSYITYDDTPYECFDIVKNLKDLL